MIPLSKWFGFDTNEILEEGIESFRRGDYENAIEALEVLESKDAEGLSEIESFLALSHARFGARLASDGLLERSAFHLERAVAARPDYPDWWLDLALTYWQLGLDERASSAVQRCLTIHPTLSRARVLQSLISADLEQACFFAEMPGATYGQLEAFAKGDLDQVSDMRAMAELHEREGNLEKAVAAYDQALAAAPQFADLHLGRGRCLAAAGDWKAACSEYETAIAINPRYAAALTARAEALQALGDVTGAESARQQAATVIGPSRMIL